MRVDAGKADAVVNAHAVLAGGSDLGSFPPPDLATVFAAEIVRIMLEATGYDGTFAASVSHVYSVDSNQSNFVIAFSGHHPDLHPNRQDTTRLLNNDLKDANHPLADRVRVSYTHLLDSAYHPMHVTTQTVFKEAFNKHADITSANVNSCLDEFRNKIKWNTIYNTGTKTVANTANPQFSQISKKVFLGVGAAGLALRMGIIKPGDEAPVVVALRGFIRQLKLLKDVPEKAGFLELATLLEKLLLSQLVTDTDKQLNLVLEDVTLTNEVLEGVRKRLVEAWGANALGRFCAEPKGLYFARNTSLIPDAPMAISGSQNPGYGFTQKGALQGQLAFWYSFTERRTFQPKLFVYGSRDDDKNPGHGAYMKPCTSCAARSASMKSGLLAPATLSAANSNNFDWMLAGELQLINELKRRYPRELDYTAAQVLANTIIARRRTLSVTPANAQDYFLKVVKDRALRMSIVL